MIKGLMGIRGVVVSGGDTSLPYIPTNTENPIQGMIRVHGTDIQVFNGSMWTNLQASYATVELDSETQSLLQWAREQRDKQSKRQALIKDNPALGKALEAIERAESNFDIMAKFVEHDQSVSI